METKQKDASVDMESNRVDTSHPMYGRKHSEETKRLIGEKARERLSDPENHPRYGVQLSDNTKSKISKANTGRVHSEKSREKMSNSRTGISQSEEHKEAISNGRTLKKFKVTLPSGDVKIIDNLHRFCIDNELHISSMYRVSRGERSPYRNYLVELLNE